MTAPSLPKGLQPLTSGYAMDDPGGVMRTDVAGGAARYALDWDRGPQRYQITLICNAMKFSVWSTFYHHTIKKGAISFTMPMDSGFGVSQHLVNIVPGSYSAARAAGTLMAVSFVAEAENQAYDMSAADAASLLALYDEYGMTSNALLERLALFANVESNVL